MQRLDAPAPADSWLARIMQRLVARLPLVPVAERDRLALRLANEKAAHQITLEHLAALMGDLREKLVVPIAPISGACLDMDFDDLTETRRHRLTVEFRPLTFNLMTPRHVLASTGPRELAAFTRDAVRGMAEALAEQHSRHLRDEILRLTARKYDLEGLS